MKKKYIDGKQISEKIQERHRDLSNAWFLIHRACILNPKGMVLKIPIIILEVIAPFIPIFFLRTIFNSLQKKENFSYVIGLSIVFATVSFLHRFLKELFTRLDGRQSTATIRLVRRDISRQIAKLPYHEIESPDTRDFLQMLDDSVDISDLIETVFHFITQSIVLLGLITIVSSLQPIFLLLIIAVLMIRSWSNKKGRQEWNNWRVPINSIYRKVCYFLSIMDTPEYGKEIRCNGLKDWLDRKMANRTIEYLDTMNYYNQKCNRYQAVLELANWCQEVLIYGYLVIQVLFFNMTIGDFTMFRSSIESFSGSLSSIMDTISELLRQGRFLEQYRELMEKVKKSDKSSVPLKSVNKEALKPPFIFRLEHVSFHYPGNQELVLQDICLEMKTGEALSIVGMNGAGKTTFVKLLCRFYEPTEGAIFVNNIDIQEIPIEEYRKLLGVVFQDFRLFAFSILENVALIPPYEEKKAWKALDSAGLHKKIEKLPKGIHTAMSKELEEEGIEFSGGESQRTGLARVLYKNAPVVILDEPTAALDPLAEYELYQLMHQMTRGKCSIFISHRLPSTRFTDHIAVFDGGRIVQYGTFDELIKKEEGIFYSFYSAQSKYYQENIEVENYANMCDT